MNTPVLVNNLIYKDATDATMTIHNLLKHIRTQGVDWVPESFGIVNTKHVLSYIEGFVPHDTPAWLWDDRILHDIATKQRQLHDATVGFHFHPAQWLMENDEENEVICHNDFAPYNCVFRDKWFFGLIDFDVCSPGSRIWDIAYTVYRFVPLLPTDNVERYHALSPFSKDTMLMRLREYLEAYSGNDRKYLYHEKEVLTKVVKRLNTLAGWSEFHGQKTQNQELLEHARMYALHAEWVFELMNTID